MELKTKINHWAQNTHQKFKVCLYGSDPNISFKTFQKKNHDAMNFVAKGLGVGGEAGRAGNAGMCLGKRLVEGRVNHPGQPLSGWPDHAAPLTKQEFRNPRRREPVQAGFFPSVICLRLYGLAPKHALSKSL